MFPVLGSTTTARRCRVAMWATGLSICRKSAQATVMVPTHADGDNRASSPSWIAELQTRGSSVLAESRMEPGSLFRELTERRSLAIHMIRWRRWTQVPAGIGWNPAPSSEEGRVYLNGLQSAKPSEFAPWPRCRRIIDVRIDRNDGIHESNQSSNSESRRSLGSSREFGTTIVLLS